MASISRLTILGAGNIGLAIANGLTQSGKFAAENITLTRRKVNLLDASKMQGFMLQRITARRWRTPTSSSWLLSRSRSMLS